MQLGARHLLIAFLVIATAVTALFVWQGHFSLAAKTQPREKLVLATPQIPYSSLLFLAKHDGLFEKHGLDVQLVVTATGKEALEMTLAGKADVAAVASLPLAHAITNGAAPRILAVISKSNYEHSVVGRSDRGIAQPADLKGKTIGILAGTSAQYYLEALLTNANVARDDVHIKSVTPQASANAIVTGEVDAIALFSPWDKRAARALGNLGVVFATPLHTTHWTLSSDARFPNTRSSAAKKLLQTLLDAQRLAAENREARLITVERELNMPRVDLGDYLKLYSFDVQLPQSLIVTLERETLWIRSHRGMTESSQIALQPLPDFLDYLSFSALHSVKPAAIKITR